VRPWRLRLSLSEDALFFVRSLRASSVPARPSPRRS
jgi:hypothetical protein